MSYVQTRKVETLIIDAFKLISLYTEGRTPPGFRMEEAFSRLNSIIEGYERNPDIIPYQKTLIFTATVGKDIYYISKLPIADVVHSTPVYINYVQMIFAGIRYPVTIQPWNVFEESRSTNSAQGLPLFCFVQRDDHGTFLKFYPKPALLYQVEVKGKFAMEPFTNLQETLEGITPSFYEFLQYSLARALRQYYPSQPWAPESEECYQLMLADFTARNDADLSMKTNDDFSGKRMTPFPLFNWNWYG